PIYPRHPVLLGQEALTLADISGGRFRLGIGVSHRPSMLSGLGLDMGRPLEAMREYVAVLRAALTGKVQHVGARYRATWQSGPPRPPRRVAGLARRPRPQDAGARRGDRGRRRALAVPADVHPHGRASGHPPWARTNGPIAR